MALTNNFILCIEETTGCQLLIALNWVDHYTPFVPLSKTAFATHPRRPTDFEFDDYTAAVDAKILWEEFLDDYYRHVVKMT